MKMLTVENLRVAFGDKQVLDGISFSVEEGMFYMVTGKNGAGKTTLLNAVAGSVAYTGTILFGTQEIRAFSPARRARHIGVLSQTHRMGFPFTVSEVVRLGRYAHREGFFAPRDDAGEEAVEKALAMTGMETLSDRSVFSLSGGEIQRMFLAQLFAQNSDILLLDEPANHLDPVYRRQLFSLVTDWLKEGKGRAVLCVMHDLTLAKAYGTGGILLHEGRILEEGDMEQVLSPGNLETAFSMDVHGWMRQMYEKW